MEKGLPIFYVDRLNYMEVAYTLRELLVKQFQYSDLQASEADVSTEELAHFLEFNILPEMLSEMLTTDFGKGMVLGSYLEYKLNIARAEEEQALKEMEEGGLG